jgi:hypothetical protein
MAEISKRFVLLHNYPHVRQAGWLAHVYANVFFDLSRGERNRQDLNLRQRVGGRDVSAGHAG